ncbi:MAG TPA: prolipoprotein diacylglyceryl transferase [Mycobacteriales bacterium]|nr:prolipoprotein diacylglyceryl transferase [Mycobacteriales bacterium]HVX69250.1 prolipoprotein diacylglyceryl transferase [Mycobacteriales bacterium]
MLPAHLPSPSQGVWHIGGLPIRAYALCIIAGVIAAVTIGDRRLVARGGRKGAVGDVAVWAVPFGLVGARIYHLVTNPELYWGGPGRSGTVGALKIWDGGLGIWGAVLFGALGAWIGCRRHKVDFAMFADSVAPGIAVAQAIGRWGNWFNQELYGRPTSLPWGLHIDVQHRIAGHLGDAYYQPTFLYESIWDLGVALVVVWLDRRKQLTHGRSLALYVMLYTAGRGWIEALRIDDAHKFLGLRLNDWTSIIVFTAAAAYFVLAVRWRREPDASEGVDAGGRVEGEPGDSPHAP